MQKISQLICLIVVLILVATISMARTVVNQAGADEGAHHLINKLQNTRCVTATVHDYVCRADSCHNTTTYYHDCVDYGFNPDCTNFTANIDICNSTNCRNTTRHIHVCVHDIAEDCANIDYKLDSCTNGACRNRTTNAHVCYNTLQLASVAVCAGAGDEDDAAVRVAMDAACVNDLLTYLSSVLHN